LTTTSQLSVALSCFTPFSNLPCSAFVVSNQEYVTGTWHIRSPQYLYWAGRTGLFNRFTVFIKHGTYTTVGIADHHIVTDMQRTVLHQYSCYSTATTI